MREVTPHAVLEVLSRHIGSEAGLSVWQLGRAVTGSAPSSAAERSVRHAIEELRRRGHHICAHPSTGYHIAADDAELTRTCEYLYSRAMCSLEQVAAMRRVSLPDLRGQLRIPS